MVMDIVFSMLLLSAGIAVLVVIHICITGRAFWRGYEDGNLVEISVNGTKKMSDEELKKLRSFEYKAGDDKGSSPVDCVVYMENFRKGDSCKLLPNCTHSFLSQCVDSRLLETPICPICRTSTGMVLGEQNGVSGHDGDERY